MAPDFDSRLVRALQDLRPATLMARRIGRAQSLEQRMMQCATPGVSLSVIDDFRLAYARGFGTGTVGAAEVSAHTPFQAGSVSKPVFALAVMRLVEDGTLDLDADVNGYLTSWQVPDNEGWKPRVTLRQLLSHTAGTTVHGFPGYPARGPWPTVVEVLQGAAPANTLPVIVDLLPGLQFRYSGGGFTIAQQVVVDLLKRPFPDLMRELVLEPLGMADSTFEQPLPAALAARAASAHPWNGVRTRGGWHVYPEMAAAGLWTTAGDLARLGVAVFGALDGKPSALRLKQESVTAMLRPQLPDQKAGQPFVGLGWLCQGEGEDFLIGHGGTNEGFLAEFKLYPRRGKGGAVMINSFQGRLIPDEILQAIGREYDWPAATQRPTLVMMPAGADYAGTYRNADGFTFVVTQAADGLSVEFGGQPPVRVRPVADTEFLAETINLVVRFEGTDGPATPVMTVIQNGKPLKLTRNGH